LYFWKKQKSMYKSLLLLIAAGLAFLLVQCKAKPHPALGIGDPVPDIVLYNQNNEQIHIKDYIGKNSLVIYFYPKDDTPGCTKEACKFRDEFEVFTNLHAKVFGISSDDVASHKAFADKYHLSFSLLSDKDNKVRKRFGVPSFGAGLIPGRVTYIIDKKGVIRYVFNSMKHPEEHIDKAIEILKSF